MTTDATKRLTTAKEAATLLSISPRLLWSITKLGQIPTVRIGGRVLYDLEDLEAFIQARKSRPKKAHTRNRTGNPILQ
jgi:excisionase family DNA binding protein